MPVTSSASSMRPTKRSTPNRPIRSGRRPADQPRIRRPRPRRLDPAACGPPRDGLRGNARKVSLIGSKRTMASAPNSLSHTASSSSTYTAYAWGSSPGRGHSCHDRRSGRRRLPGRRSIPRSRSGRTSRTRRAARRHRRSAAPGRCLAALDVHFAEVRACQRGVVDVAVGRGGDPVRSDRAERPTPRRCRSPG